MVDGVVQGILNVDATHIKNHRSGSNMVVVKLKPGNKVWVEPSHTYAGQFAYAQMSSFSGFKLWWMNLYNHSISNKENISCLRFYHSNLTFLQEISVQWFQILFSFAIPLIEIIFINH